jgi:hypothetical protein
MATLSRSIIFHSAYGKNVNNNFYSFLLVIEVSCGEYGDNIRKLVNAIQNGKHDIRTGRPFPEFPPAEVLNNAEVKLSNGNGVLDTSAVENGDSDGVKYADNAAANVNLYQPFATKDVTKEEQSKFEIQSEFGENYYIYYGQCC